LDEIDELLAAVARQDARAFRTLYDRTSGRLMAVTLRICRDRGTAEEILQEIYVRVWRRSDLFDPARGSGLAWLTVLARRRAIDHVRSAARRPAAAGDRAETAVETLPDLTAGAEMLSDLRALKGCLDRLEPRHSEAVLLAYYNGWSREELARHFGIPDGTVKTWLRRGLIALRGCMDGE
jgi:RNA polymerase sigma-70 factor (ECF subfamily)